MKLIAFYAWVVAATLVIYYGKVLFSKELKRKTFEFYFAHVIIWSTIAATIVGLIYLSLLTFNFI